MPKLSQRKSNSDKGVRSSLRPYTAMAVSALQAGLTWRDLRHMKYTHLMQILWEWEDMNGADVDETVDAKPSDVSILMSM